MRAFWMVAIMICIAILGGCSSADEGGNPDKDKEALKRFDTAGADNAPKSAPPAGTSQTEGL